MSGDEPMPVPPKLQSGFDAMFGPQTKNETMPVTAPFGPPSVAVSVIGLPM